MVSSINHIQVDKEIVQAVVEKFKDSVFNPGLGKVNGIQAKLHLKEGAVPKFHKACTVSLSKRHLVEAALNQLEVDDVIEKVDYSEWVAPIVAPLKEEWRG